jgi:Fur family transcriptional regulator, ferric uptake regulator
MIRKKQNKSKALKRTQPVTLCEAHGLLRAQGKRITGQRALLLQLIQESTGHLDAGELCCRAQKRAPRLNLATVYRTLNLLKEAGLVEPRYLTHDHRREQFESKAATEHYHFTCVECGRVIEFESPLVEGLRREVKRQFGVEFTHACLCFEGYCAECSPKHQ